MEAKNNVISKDTYSQYVSSRMELKDIVEKLKGKILKDEYRTIEDCAVDFVGDLLTRDWGRSIVYIYNKKESDFISSKYLSDYFKDSISQLLDGTKSKEIENILNSDKDINEMSEEDIINTSKLFSFSTVCSFSADCLVTFLGFNTSKYP